MHPHPLIAANDASIPKTITIPKIRANARAASRAAHQEKVRSHCFKIDAIVSKRKGQMETNDMETKNMIGADQESMGEAILTGQNLVPLLSQ
jgi:hypothetical protein